MDLFLAARPDRVDELRVARALKRAILPAQKAAAESSPYYMLYAPPGGLAVRYRLHPIHWLGSGPGLIIKVFAQINGAYLFVVHQFFRGAGGQYLPIVDDEAPVADAQSFAHIVIGNQHADTACF